MWDNDTYNQYHDLSEKIVHGSSDTRIYQKATEVSGFYREFLLGIW